MSFIDYHLSHKVCLNIEPKRDNYLSTDGMYFFQWLIYQYFPTFISISTLISSDPLFTYCFSFPFNFLLSFVSPIVYQITIVHTASLK